MIRSIPTNFLIHPPKVKRRSISAMVLLGAFLVCLSSASLAKEPSNSGEFPGNSLANFAKALSKDVKKNIKTYLKKEHSCRKFEVVNTEHVSMVEDTLIDGRGRLVSGSATELWTLEACGKSMKLDLVLAADGNKGSYVAIRAVGQDLEIADQTEDLNKLFRQMAEAGAKQVPKEHYDKYNVFWVVPEEIDKEHAKDFANTIEKSAESHTVYMTIAGPDEEINLEFLSQLVGYVGKGEYPGFHIILVGSAGMLAKIENIMQDSQLQWLFQQYEP